MDDSRIEAVDGGRLDATVRSLLDHPDLESLFDENPGLVEELMSATRDVSRAAFIRQQTRALKIAHATLAHLYRENFRTPGLGEHLRNQFSPQLLQVRLILEHRWEQYERSRCAEWRDIGPDAFLAAYKELVQSHRVAHHPLSDYLAEKANPAAVARYVTTDGALALSYFDFIAITLLGEANMVVQREVVSNLCDEVGLDGAQRHTVLMKDTLSSVGASQEVPTLAEGLDWRGLAGINLFYMLSVNRRLRDEFIGAASVGEDLDPPHNEKVVAGCRRVGLNSKDTTEFYTTHIELERQHGDAWLENVALPTAERHPGAAAAMLAGAHMRLNTCADYYDEVLEALLADSKTAVSGR